MARRTKVRRVARRVYAKIRRHAPKKYSIAVIGGLAYGLLKPHPLGNQNDWENDSMIGKAMHGNYVGLAQDMLGKITGFQNGFHPEYLVDTYGPVLVGAGVSKVMDMVGVNKQFAKLPGPFKRVKI